MEKEFIPYKQALALKELGFDEPCFGYYTGDKKHLVLRPNMGRRNEDLNDIVCTSPLYQQAFRWFREKHNMDSYHIEPTNNMFGNFYGVLGLRTATFNGGFKTYEEAELACLKKLIEIVKQ